MAQRSGIEWTETTWNPVTGCDRVSTGCDNCYALSMARRLKAMGVEKYQLDGNPVTSGPGFGVAMHPDTLQHPKAWASSRMVFVNSMSDLFHAHVTPEFISDVFAVMRATPQHTYQVLTKRAMRAKRLSANLDWPENLWLGVSVENMAVSHRVRDLIQTGAKVKFLSCEPLLGDLSSLDLSGIDWVIAGGESGHGYRPVEISWVRNLRDRCVREGIPFFFKQWGGRTSKVGGRDLDGEVWSQMPPQAQRHAS